MSSAAAATPSNSASQASATPTSKPVSTTITVTRLVTTSYPVSTITIMPQTTVVAYSVATYTTIETQILAIRASSNNIAPIAGGVVGGASVLACLFIFFCMYRRRKMRDRQEWEDAYDAGRNAAAEETYFTAVDRKPVDPNDGNGGSMVPYTYSPEISQYGTMPDSINSQSRDLHGPGSAYGYSFTEESTTPARQRHQSMFAGDGVAPINIYASSTLSGGSSEYSSSAGGGGVAAGLAPGMRYSKAQEAAADVGTGRGPLSPIMQHQDAGPVEEVPPTYGGML